MKYCKKCVYPDIAVNLRIQENDICTSCQTSESIQQLTDKDWSLRKIEFEKIIPRLNLSILIQIMIV